jgi:hypothetical protein
MTHFFLQNFLKLNRFGSVSALLADGTILFAAEPASQVYDPVTASFSLRGPVQVTWAVPGGNTFTPDYIVEQTATLLLNGKLLLAGGENEDTGYYRTAQLYDPVGRVYSYRKHAEAEGRTYCNAAAGRRCPDKGRHYRTVRR